MWFRVFVFSLLRAMSFHPALLVFAQNPDQGNNVRTITLTAKDKQPGFTLRISAKGRKGLVEVRNDLNHDRPYWPRLIPVQSCVIQNNLASKTPVAVVTHYAGRSSTVTGDS